MNFRNLQARVNGSVLKHLSNSVVSIEGVEHPGIFKRPFQVVHLGSGIADSRPTVAMDSSSLPDDPVSIALLVDSIGYTVAEAQPDGTGMSCLFLEYA